MWYFEDFSDPENHGFYMCPCVFHIYFIIVLCFFFFLGVFTTFHENRWFCLDISMISYENNDFAVK